MKLSSHNNQCVRLQGFTLIELLVATSLFISALTIAIGALFSAQATFVRVETNAQNADNLNSIVDFITRSLRYGTMIHCGGDSSNSAVVIDLNGADASQNLRRSCGDSSSNPMGTFIVFKPVSAQCPNDRIGFYASTTGGVYEYQATGNAPSCTSYTYAQPIKLNSDTVQISQLLFTVIGANTTQEAKDAGSLENADSFIDYRQPYVTLVIKGKSTTLNKIDTTPFAMQASVVIRSMDF